MKCITPVPPHLTGPRNGELPCFIVELEAFLVHFSGPNMAPLMTGDIRRETLAFRSSQRLTITLPFAILEALVERSRFEGRSLSNLAAYLLESSLERPASAQLTAVEAPYRRS